MQDKEKARRIFFRDYTTWIFLKENYLSELIFITPLNSGKLFGVIFKFHTFFPLKTFLVTHSWCIYAFLTRNLSTFKSEAGYFSQAIPKIINISRCGADINYVFILFVFFKCLSLTYQHNLEHLVTGLLLCYTSLCSFSQMYYFLIDFGGIAYFAHHKCLLMSQ